VAPDSTFTHNTNTRGSGFKVATVKTAGKFWTIDLFKTSYQLVPVD
jgi:hypothetical protein